MLPHPRNYSTHKKWEKTKQKTKHNKTQQNTTQQHATGQGKY